MPGVPGSGGPIPKRSDQRRRRNKPEVPVTHAEGSADIEVPKANSKWHPVAKRWFESLAQSGQSAFYQASDWATAYVIAEDLSRELKPQVVGTTEEGEPVYAHVPLKGASVSAFLKACSVLLVTEGDRRRARLELERERLKPGGEAEEVASLDDFRRRLGAG